MKRRKVPKARLVVPTREQFQVLLNTIRTGDVRACHGGDLVELLAYSGMRLGEARELLWGDVDFARGVFTVTGGEIGTKNHEARTVPLFPPLRELLERLSAAGELPTTSAKVVPINDAKKAIDTACRKSGLPHFTHHKLRHYFVSNAIEVGVDFKTLAAWVGHKDGGVLVARTYGHLRDVHSFDMAKLMTFGYGEATPQNVVTLSGHVATS